MHFFAAAAGRLFASKKTPLFLIVMHVSRAYGEQYRAFLYNNTMIQEQALDVLKTGANVFLTGEPGSGKTHTVSTYVRWLQERNVPCAVTASTGIAATHINGRTVHSWSGIGVRTTLTPSDLNTIASNARIAKRIRQARILVIDEISMLSADTFTAIETVCRRMRKNDEPFGSLQVILVGDFFQLPPVVKAYQEDIRQKTLLGTEDAGSVFAFSSPAWTRANLSVCYLSEQHRQEDPAFLDVLLAIRQGIVTGKHRALLQSRSAGASHPGMTQLFSHNKDVDAINNAELSKLLGETHEFTMLKKGAPAIVDQLARGCLSPEALALKTGCRVMFTKNDPLLRYANGTLGFVVGFSKETGHPVVKTHTNRLVTAEPAEWSVEDAGSVVARIIQIPLRLAWAMTVHKSQGMSLDSAHMDLSRVFEYGQGYVALSRVRTLQGLSLGGINERALCIHPHIAKKDAEFRAASQSACHHLSACTPHEILKKQNDFIEACGGKKIVQKAYSVKTIREKRANAYRAWSAEEDEDMMDRYRAGDRVADIAALLGRNLGAIRSRLKKITEDYD